MFTNAQLLQYDFTELSRELRREEVVLENALGREGLTKLISRDRLHNVITVFEAAAVSISHQMNIIPNQALSRVREHNNRLPRAQRAFLLPLGTVDQEYACGTCV
ncbi:hypothetical protein PsorP6_008376 [Peronosclerospora sorghi]|uniref:Uncharacterized protein n=1 Tax=Peronosclerospora sorghi TaxID=230839 RepID=A0ACC0W6K3_9STRA|nr:hypothetical protein PsorP6_008376 [Peronosclerospora sorghi]